MTERIRKMIIAILLIIMISSFAVGCGNEPAPNNDETTKAQNATNEKEEDTSQKVGEKEAEYYYELGRSYLYGSDGNERNLENAYNSFLQAEELGCNDANFYLGVLYDWYNYPKQDYEMARTYYEACEDNPYAQISLAMFYLYGEGYEKNEEKGKEMLQSAIDRGCVEGYLGLAYLAEDEEEYTTAFEYYNKVLDGTEQMFINTAMYKIGSMYYKGSGVEQNDAKALEWFEKAAEAGNDDANYIIGYMYYVGKRVEQDYAKALEWLEKAAESGKGEAMYIIGCIHYYGKGVEQDYVKALEWFEKSAGLGDSYAMHILGYIYEYGTGVEQDYVKALEWYEKSVEAGNPSAMNVIGHMYSNGLGTEQDYAKALEWYEKAAETGSYAAMYNIGSMYYYGTGVEQDYAKALEWYKKSAELGYFTAMDKIGSMYYYGDGVEQDYSKALEWFEKAAESGDELAKKHAEDAKKHLNQ